MSKKFKWKIEIEVDEFWVKEGFDLDKNDLFNIAKEILPLAYKDEIKVKIFSAPDPKEIRKIQDGEA